MHNILQFAQQFAIVASFPAAIIAGAVLAGKFDKKAIVPSLVVLIGALAFMAPHLPLFKFTVAVIVENLVTHVTTGTLLFLAGKYHKEILNWFGSKLNALCDLINRLTMPGYR